MTRSKYIRLPAEQQKQITKKQRDFICHYRKTGGDIDLMVKQYGYTNASIARFLRIPLVNQEIKRTLQYCRDRLEAMSPEILTMLRGMMNSAETPANVRANIGINLLDRAGLGAPKEVEVNMNVNTRISDKAREILAERLQKEAEVIDV